MHQKQAEKSRQQKAGTSKISPPKTPKSSPPKTPSLATPHSTPPKEYIADPRGQYLKHGLPSAPKNPKTRETVPFETALERIKNDYYGEEVSSRYMEGDTETCKQVLYLAGRDFGAHTWSPEYRKKNDDRDT